MSVSDTASSQVTVSTKWMEAVVVTSGDRLLIGFADDVLMVEQGKDYAQEHNVNKPNQGLMSCSFAMWAPQVAGKFPASALGN